jgi:hypothetical protein
MFEVYASYGMKFYLVVYLSCSLDDVYDVAHSLVDEMYIVHVSDEI